MSWCAINIHVGDLEVDWSGHLTDKLRREDALIHMLIRFEPAGAVFRMAAMTVSLSKTAWKS
jgi:hypothetical protein